MTDTSDTAPIRALWARMAEGWAAASGERFADVFAPDAEFVSVRGESQQGRALIAQSHATLFRTRYQETTLSVDIRRIRRISADAAVVHVASTVRPAGGGAGMDTHAQAVVERIGEQWLITAFHNMIPFTPAT